MNYAAPAKIFNGRPTVCSGHVILSEDDSRPTLDLAQG